MLLCGQFIVMQWRRIDGVLFVIGNLITCKRYISIDFSSSKLKKEPAFLDRLGDIVGEEIALFEPHVSKYLCEPGDVKVTKCIKIKKDLQQAIKDQFHENKSETHVNQLGNSSCSITMYNPCRSTCTSSRYDQSLLEHPRPVRYCNNKLNNIIILII